MANFKNIDDWKVWKYIESKTWLILSKKIDSGTSAQWVAWEKASKEKYPILYWIFETFPNHWEFMFNWTNNLYWQFQWRFNPKHKYNKITFAKPGYYDCDRQILFAVCELVSKFVEFQETEGHVNWDYDENHRSNFKTMQEIRDYWRKEFPNRDNDFLPYPDYIDDKDFFSFDRSKLTEQQRINLEYWSNHYGMIEERHFKREQEILQKALNIRRYMVD